MKHARAVSAENTPAWTVFPELEPVESGAPKHLRGRLRKSSEFGTEKLARVSDRQIKATTLKFSNMSHYGDLFVEYLRARKSTFIDAKHWDLPESEGMEFDQYDTPLSRWIAIHEYGEILGGIRLTPTTARCGIYSYMLRDAQLGLLDNIPTDVLFFKAPVDTKVWEATRLFIADGVPAKRRLQVQALLMNQLMISGGELGATHVIGIVPAVWSRWLRRLDLSAVAVGPRFQDGDTISQAALFNVVKLPN